MTSTLHILVVEDSEQDTLLFMRELRRGGYTPDWQRVETGDAMREALDRQPWDVVLIGSTAPSFSAYAALQLIQQRGLLLPCIVVSDVEDTATAVAMMKAGAHDYMLKDNLTRLVSALEHELRAAANRQERQQAEMEQTRYRQHLEKLVATHTEELEQINRQLSSEIIKRQRAETSLRESQTLFQEVLDHSPAGIFAKDHAGRYLLVNRRAAAFLRNTPTNILGKTCDEFMPPDVARAWSAQDAQVLATQASAEFEGRFTPGSRGYAYHTTLFPLYNAQGELYGIGGISTDITERKQIEDALRESEALLSSIYNVANIGLCVTDEHGYFVRINQAYCDIYQRTQDEIVGKHFGMMLPDETREYATRIHDAFIAGAPESAGEWLVQRKDGTLITILVTAALLIRDDGRRFKVTSVTDITERKHTEAEVITLSEHLAKRAADLEAANADLETFSFSVAHDLRSPLWTIEGFSQALLEDYAAVLGDEGQDFLRRILSATRRMNHLIDDLLKLSTVTRRELFLEPVNLSSLVRMIIAELQHRDQQRSVTYTIEDEVYATGDGRLLRVALENLLDNAWKFTSRQTQASISFETARHNGDFCYVVRDNGVGFDMKKAQHLFGAFQRLHNQNDFPGTGIGLATVQRIIQRHGGQIWAESAVGAGAAFYFTLTTAPEKDVQV